MSRVQRAYDEDPTSTRPALDVALERATEDDGKVLKALLSVGGTALEATDQVRSLNPQKPRVAPASHACRRVPPFACVLPGGTRAPS